MSEFAYPGWSVADIDLAFRNGWISQEEARDALAKLGMIDQDKEAGE